MFHSIVRATLAALALVCASLAQAQGCQNKLVVFGDSLTDPGNFYAATGTTSKAPYSLIPNAPYAIGGHHFSNGRTWAEQLAESISSPASGLPALANPGQFTNYAVGGARARPGASPGRSISTSSRSNSRQKRAQTCFSAGSRSLKAESRSSSRPVRSR